MNRDYLPLPNEYMEEMRELSDAEFGRLIRALQEYTITGKEPTLTGSERYFSVRCVNRDKRYREAFATMDQKRRSAAKKGAAARWNKSEKDTAVCDTTEKNATVCDAMEETALVTDDNEEEANVCDGIEENAVAADGNDGETKVCDSIKGNANGSDCIRSDAIDAYTEAKAETETEAEANICISPVNGRSTPKRSKTEFVPPTVGDVRAYCEGRGKPIDAERFVNFYESKGWLVGKSPMKDWKAAARNWAEGNSSSCYSSPKSGDQQKSPQNYTDILSNFGIRC